MEIVCPFVGQAFVTLGEQCRDNYRNRHELRDEQAAFDGHVAVSLKQPGLALAVEFATATQPSLAGKRISPHTLRHSTAMHLLQSGVPFNIIIALWLGHESVNTTHQYVEADLSMKEKALGNIEEPDTKLKRFRASDSLMRFLEAL
jgi:site-specific recombinase XerD